MPSLLGQVKADYLYPPLYSPDLNPINKPWSKLLRKFKTRSVDELPVAIQKAFRSVTIFDCLG